MNHEATKPRRARRSKKKW